MEADVKRLIERLDEIYSCGIAEDGSFSRLAFTEGDIRGRTKFISYFEQLGIKPRVDEACNIIARLEGKNGNYAPIIIGSHLDSVPNGGKYDGVYGCLAALAVMEAVVKSGETPEHPLEVIVFADEEGARFGSGLMGSGMFSGAESEFPDTAVDANGITRGEALRAIGIDPTRMREAERPKDGVHCVLELHVEQGARLHKKHLPIGVVSSIAGVRRYEVTVTGQPNHSGSTLMPDRKDALVAASRFIGSVPEIVSERGGEFSVATVGTIRVSPNAVNVIPGECVFSLEIRDPSEETISSIEEGLKNRLHEVCTEVTYTFERIAGQEPAPMTDWVKSAIKESCEKLEFEYEEMPSGAFHDSLPLSCAFPTGMIFIPSVGGLSHSPLELSEAPDIEKGCNVLMHTVLAVDKAAEL